MQRLNTVKTLSVPKFINKNITKSGFLLCNRYTTTFTMTKPVSNTVIDSSMMRHFSTGPSTYNKNSGGNSSTSGVSIPEEILTLSNDVYHKESDLFLENILEELETISEENYQLIPEVELNQGVLNFEIAGNGSYVINKQPPNKQIWFSSPISGPKRFDFYKNSWVSLRENITLVDTLNKELKDASNGKYSLTL